MGEKKGHMVMTPIGAFKSPNDPECKTGKVASEVAHAAAAMLSSNMEGLHFIAATHAAHYKSCEACRAANPNPDPKPTEEDRAEAEKFRVDMEAKMEKVGKDPLTAALNLLTTLGVDPSELLSDEAVRELLGKGHKDSPTSPQPKRPIGFVN